MNEEERDLVVTDAEAGQRLDRLVVRLVGVSRVQAREILRRGAVRIDGRPCGESDKGLRVEPGMHVEIARVDLDAVEPSQREAKILAVGNGWVATDKPPGVPVHPLRGDDRDTMLQRLVTRFPAIVGVGEGGRRSGVVHRLDVDTSGVQLFAFEEATWQWLRAAFREHRVDKVYRALVEGHPPELGAVELDLTIATHRPARVVAVDAGRGGPKSRRCRTRWRVLQQFSDAALVEVRPSTGFLHQVRATFAHLGHPLLGDTAYGGDGSRAPRHMLHASAIRFESIDVTADDADDFSRVLASLAPQED